MCILYFAKIDILQNACEFVYILSKIWLVAWLVGDHFVLKGFGLCGIIWINALCYRPTNYNDNAFRDFGPRVFCFLVITCCS
jgi:hypothetical protein